MNSYKSQFSHNEPRVNSVSTGSAKHGEPRSDQYSLRRPSKVRAELCRSLSFMWASGAGTRQEGPNAGQPERSGLKLC